MHKTRGGLLAGTLWVLPSLVLLILLSWIYMAFGQPPLLADTFYGIKPAVTAMVLHALHRVMENYVESTSSARPVCISSYNFCSISGVFHPISVGSFGRIGAVCSGCGHRFGAAPVGLCLKLSGRLQSGAYAQTP